MIDPTPEQIADHGAMGVDWTLVSRSWQIPDMKAALDPAWVQIAIDGKSFCCNKCGFALFAESDEVCISGCCKGKTFTCAQCGEEYTGEE